MTIYHCNTDIISQDCNGDGKVDCVDYAAIHTLGPFGCQNKGNLNFWNRIRRKGLLKCMVTDEEGQYAKEMRRLNEKLRLQDFAAKKRAELEGKSVVEEKKHVTQYRSEISIEKTGDNTDIVVDILEL